MTRIILARPDLVPKFVINNVGNVGIGTGKETPQSLLQIGDGLAGGYRSWMDPRNASCLEY